MQKIQFYLVPNRLTVTTDLVGFTTEFRQVYQQQIKLYKGIDNTIEMEIKNSEQRKQDVAGYTAELQFFDSARHELFTATGTPVLSSKGLISVTIPAADIADIDPQQLQVAARLVKAGSPDSIIYADSQFGLLGTVLLQNGYNPVAASGDIIEELTTFNYDIDAKEYVSEIGRFGTGVNSDQTITVEVTGAYDGIINVDATNQMSTAFGTRWTQLADWDSTAPGPISYSGDYRFIRFRYGGQTKGRGATFNVTVTNGVYTNVDIVYRGNDYQLGDQLYIKGSLLGGNDGANDLTINVVNINVYPPGSLDSVTGVTWSGTAPIMPDTEYYRNVLAANISSSKTIDKITIRN
jgi:hypothetical protein